MIAVIVSPYEAFTAMAQKADKVAASQPDGVVPFHPIASTMFCGHIRFMNVLGSLTSRAMDGG
jgi:hypothetical protein